jgi:hypothetical protein
MKKIAKQLGLFVLAFLVFLLALYVLLTVALSLPLGE